MWQALNPPQLQAPLFGPCLLFAVGILVFELPHEPLTLAVGVLLIAKPKRLVMGMVRLKWDILYHRLLTHSKKVDQKGNPSPIHCLGHWDCYLWDRSSHATAKPSNKIIPQACDPCARRLQGAIVGF